MGTPWRKYTEEMLSEAVEHSTSVMGVLRYLGLPQAGGTHAHISRMIKKFEIDTSHFVRYQNGAHRVRLKPVQILVRIPRGANRTKPHMLRRALVEIGRPYCCEICGNHGTWMGVPLSLDIDHIDDDFHNNLARNLRYLCPNCHAQTPNFAGRSKNKYAHVLPDRSATLEGHG
jgi:hypothetical protein